MTILSFLGKEFVKVSTYTLADKMAADIAICWFVEPMISRE